MNKEEKQEILNLCEQLPLSSVYHLINILTAMVQVVKSQKEKAA